MGTLLKEQQLLEETPSGYTKYVRTVSQITSDADDVEQQFSPGSNFYPTSDDLEIGYIASNHQNIGMMFRNLDIPQGATILEAYVQFESLRAETGTLSATVYAEDADNPNDFATFTGTSGTDDLNSRTRTSASVSWPTIPDWGLNQNDADTRTPDISSVIQEVVNRSGYTSASKINIIVEPDGVNQNNRAPKSAQSVGPVLYVKYSEQITSGDEFDVYDLGELVAWLHRDGIDPYATAQNDNVNDWMCMVTGKIFDNKVGQPTLDINATKREVQFAATSALYALHNDFLELNLVPLTDEFSIVVLIGNDAGLSGTLVGKTTNGQDDMQYQFNYHTVSAGYLGANLGSLTGADRFIRTTVTGGGPLAANALCAIIAGDTEYDAEFWYEGNLEAVNWTGDSAPTEEDATGRQIGSATNTHPIYIGARRNNSDTAIGYQFEGSIAHVLFFKKKLTDANLDTINTKIS